MANVVGRERELSLAEGFLDSAGERFAAQDDVDGALPATCRPRSGSWFSVGRTRVRCSATDTSANESAATFAVTVKRTR